MTLARDAACTTRAAPQPSAVHVGVAPEIDTEQDISRGLEPVPIPLDCGGGPDALQALRATFHRYVTDSVLPNGTDISQVAHQPEGNIVNSGSPDSRSDSGSFGSDTDLGCLCPVTPGSCSSKTNAECDCVAQFGNYYSADGAASSGARPVLQLDLLPEDRPLVECGQHCECGSECSNRLTQSGVRASLVVSPAGPAGAGLGCFYRPSNGDPGLPKGAFISLYAGEYLDAQQAAERWAAQAAAGEGPVGARHRGQGNYILSLRLPSGVVHIDPRHVGNVGRFLNHSCAPNCVIQPVHWGIGPHVWPRAAIFTNRDISSGEELTFDYANASGSSALREELADGNQGTPAVNGRTVCLCSSASCRGWMPFDPSL